MEFSKIDMNLKHSGRDGKSELLSNVYRLVECFMQSDDGLQTSFDTVDKSIAGKALVAATLAERRIKELAERILNLEKLSVTDELTGLMNRRGFVTELERAFSAAERYDERGVLIYIDLDDFKPVNDRFGHAAGDEVLRHVARILAENIRDTDYIGRLGGDEFAVLMPRTIWKNGLSRAGVIEKCLNAAQAQWQDQSITIQASLGLQSYSSGDTPSDILERADEAMYNAKRYRSTLERGTFRRAPVKNDATEQPVRHLMRAAS